MENILKQKNVSNRVICPSGCLSRKAMWASSTFSFSMPSFFTSPITTFSSSSGILLWNWGMSSYKEKKHRSWLTEVSFLGHLSWNRLQTLVGAQLSQNLPISWPLLGLSCWPLKMHNGLGEAPTYQTGRCCAIFAKGGSGGSKLKVKEYVANFLTCCQQYWPYTWSLYCHLYVCPYHLFPDPDI